MATDGPTGRGLTYPTSLPLVLFSFNHKLFVLLFFVCVMSVVGVVDVAVVATSDAVVVVVFALVAF